MTRYILPLLFSAFLAGATYYVKERRANAPVTSQGPFSEAIAPAGGSESIIFAAADQYGVPRDLARAVLSQESGGDAGATSPVGAAGLMQVMPDTAVGIAADLGIASYDIYDPQTNAMFGMYYLSGKVARYGVVWGLAAYNWGPSAVDGFLERHPDAAAMEWASVVASYGGEIPAETQGYVRSILARMEGTQAVDTTPRVSSNPISLAGDCGWNVRVALEANGGALQTVIVQPGETFSFNATIGDPAFVPYRWCAGVPAGMWCDLAARYIQVARKIGLPSDAIQFQHHGIQLNDVAWEDSVSIWNVGGAAGFENGAQDLLIENTTGRILHFQSQSQGDSIVIAGSVE